jgi:hypothetical protein
VAEITAALLIPVIGVDVIIFVDSAAHYWRVAVLDVTK